nr:MAG TPA: hypothetical protein [Caudoviricetes sp.]
MTSSRAVSSTNQSPSFGGVRGGSLPPRLLVYSSTCLLVY